MKYNTSTVSPGAWVTKNKSRLKIYESSKVFLNDREEFEIELFNPLKSRVLAQINLNGTKTLSIVINPGQRIFLERFLEEKKKFMFSTYRVEDTKESKSAIEDNGKISIVFYQENLFDLSSNYLYTDNNLIWNTGGERRITLNGGTSFQNFANNFTSSNASYNVSNTIETGRIEGGGNSNQNFSSTSGNFSWYIGSFNYQILPMSTKLHEASDIRQYCTNCGTRVRNSNWKYCPKCGTKLD